MERVMVCVPRSDGERGVATPPADALRCWCVTTSPSVPRRDSSSMLRSSRCMSSSSS